MNYSKYRDKRIVYASGLRAARYGTPGSFTVEQWLGLCSAWDNTCAECRMAVPLTADHIVPLSKGGDNNISNVQPLCRSCNARKSDKILDKEPDRRPIKPIPPLERDKNWGGARKGSGRPGKLAYIKLPLHSDKLPVYPLSMDVYCQTSGCFMMTNQSIIHTVDRIVSFRPVCVMCIKESGYEPLIRKESVKNEAD